MNSDLAKAFDRIADLLELTGADPFRINSYRKVARTIRDQTDHIRVLHEAGRVPELPGVGKATAAKIEEFITTGSIRMLVELEERVPPGLPALLNIPGLGPKKILQFHTALGIKDLDDLKHAIDSGTLEKLPGMGPQSVAKIKDGIAFLESAGGRTPRGLALPLAEALAEFVRGLPGVERVEIGGSMRRGLETIGDLDLLAAAEDGAAVVSAFVQGPRVHKVLASGGTKGSVLATADDGRAIQVDLRVVPRASFGAAWQYFTGSKEHNVRLREMAAKRGWKLNEWGLYEGEKAIAGETEESIYAALGLPWIPPEVREDREEFSPPWGFDELVTRADIRGELHLHTRASDGKNTIEEMARAARELGYAYLAITDHSASSTIANGLSPQRLREHIQAVRAAEKKVGGIRLLTGCECDILPNGTLDYPDDLLAECDIVVASIHAAMGRGGAGKATPTERTLQAIENRYVTIIGHPSGRLIQQRPAMELDLALIVQAAKATGTALEVNASWHRLDLKDGHVRQAVGAGVPISINTDAHRTTELGRLDHGLATARRGYARAADVINTWPLEQLLAWTACKRGR
jgi:DNA polymerase (family 10)